MLKRCVERIEFRFQPPHTDTAEHATASQHVEPGQHLGLHDGMAVWHDDDTGANLDARSHRRDEAEQSEGLNKRHLRWSLERAVRGVGITMRGLRRKHDVVAGPERVEPEFFGAYREALNLIAIEQGRISYAEFHG